METKQSQHLEWWDNLHPVEQLQYATELWYDKGYIGEEDICEPETLLPKDILEIWREKVGG